MSKKINIKTQFPMRSMLIAQIVLGILFLPLGVIFVFIAEGEAKLFAAIFALIWLVGCALMIIHSVKVLRLVKKGEFQIAEISNEDGGKSDDFAVKLRELEKLKAEKLISQDEYKIKRDEILKEKW